MIITNSQWNAAYKDIEEYRELKLARLASGDCEMKEYYNICGILEGLDIFEAIINNNLKEKERRNVSDEDET